MAKYELTLKQVQNLQALLMDANIKGAAAETIVELMQCLENPVDESVVNDLHGKHNDAKGHGTDSPEENNDSRH